MSFSWDRDNRRFVTRTRCPWPGCGEPAEPFHQGGMIGWCETCQRPYESTLLAPAQGGAPVEWNVCPTSVFNTFTGQAVRRYSPVDWSEAGGAPDRSGCADDARGSVFGRVSTKRSWSIAPAWHLDSIAPEEQNRVGDSVAALAVMRGRVLVLSERGRISFVDPLRGDLLSGRPIDWPGFPTPDAENPVSFAPVVRGTWVVVSSPMQALFRDLAPQLALGASKGAARWKIISPSTPARRLVGPPLGLDTDTGPRVCLMEAEASSEAGLREPTLRFFELDGRELGSCSCEGLVRPPVFERHSQQLLWLDGGGFVHRLPIADLDSPLPLPALPTEPLLPLRASLHPTFCLAPSQSGKVELWVGHQQADGQVGLSHCDLAESERRGEVRWITRPVGARGGLLSMSVGRGPHHPQNVAGQLVAISTDQGVFSFPKDLVDAMEHQAARGHDAADHRGSWDQPVVCDVGVLTRVSGTLHLMGTGTPWARENGRRVTLPLRYAQAQGLVLYGRMLIYGVSMGLGAHCLTLEESP